MAGRVIQRVVFGAERDLQALYYRLAGAGVGPPPEPDPPDRFSVRLRGAGRLSTETYFNTFFERYWRRYARLGSLRLRLELAGSGTVRLLRRSPTSCLSLLGSADFAGDRAGVVLEVPPPESPSGEAGTLHFEVEAGPGPVWLRGAEWVAEGVEAEPVRLVVGYCTFNRTQFLVNNLRALLADPGVTALLERVVVVDQGTDKVRDHPAFAGLQAAWRGKLRLIEQANFGGAGGFTRSILEARSAGGGTHMLLMDDDAVLEPESVFRAGALLALARQEIAVGAPMLDLARRLEVYEAGGWVHPSRLSVSSPVHRRPVATPEALAPFREVTPTHYNAWWFFAFPLRLVDRVGLPLPLFLRGDDAEFGCRLLGAGVPTVTVPGLGVWHEPFYRKKGGWYPYYDLRNMLVLTVLHFPHTRFGLAKGFLLRLVHRLLLLDYAHAALLCQAVEDFCRGPEHLEADPRVAHRERLALQQALAPEALPRARPSAEGRVPAPPWSGAGGRGGTEPGGAPPAGRLRQGGRLLRCLGRQLLRRSPPGHSLPRAVVGGADAVWWELGVADVVAVDDGDAAHYTVRRRSRRRFVRLLGRGLVCAFRLLRGYGRVAGRWRAAFPGMTGSAFWRRYLGMADGAPGTVAWPSTCRPGHFEGSAGGGGNAGWQPGRGERGRRAA